MNMEMDQVVSTLRPLRRTNSLPGSFSAPTRCCYLPDVLEDAVNGARQSFATYDEGMKLRDIISAAHPSDEGITTAAPSNRTADSPVDAPEKNSSNGGENENENVRVVEAAQAQQHEGSTSHNSNDNNSTADDNGLNDNNNNNNIDEGDAASSSRPSATPSTTGTELVSSGACIIPYAPELMAEWMLEYRDSTAHCPAGIVRFIESKKTAGPSKGTATFASRVGTMRGEGGKQQQQQQHQGAAPAAVDSNEAPQLTGKMALNALGNMWEDRKDIPIAVGSGFRRKGLFGEAERKELHQMVVAVLNKVTTDPEKFREVKNELLRLPIPEATPEQLALIVDVFFVKAVREQHFSHCYADLIAALCKVPEGQCITGDKRLSLEYRLRQALVKRCQKEFVSATAHEQEQQHDDDEATAKEHRDRMCGNVRFVSELFLRGMVTDAVITVIIHTCCTGSEFGAFVMPPVYTPTESQMDQLMTLSQAVGAEYFNSTAGQQLLPHLLANLAYWREKYPVSRCRFLLMSKVEQLRVYLHVELPPPPPPPPQQALFSPMGLTSSTPREQTSSSVGDGAAADYRAALLGTPPNGESSPTRKSLKSSSVITVGGQPLPAPRSQRLNSLSTSQNSAVIPPSPHPQPDSPMDNLAMRKPQPQPLPPPQPPQQQQQQQPIVSVRAEHISKYMADLNSADAPYTPDSIVAEWIQRYGDVRNVLAMWTARCLSVVKEENTRLKSADIMAELVRMNCMTRDDIRATCFKALMDAVSAALHEDLKVFKFWAQLILADRRRAVLDEALLEDGLQFLVDRDPDAAASYLSDVGMWYQRVQATSPMCAADESSDFMRYRPLRRLLELSQTDMSPQRAARLQAIIEQRSVRESNMEVSIYCTLMKGSTPVSGLETLFEGVRTSPRLRSDSSLAAEIVSAALLASDGPASQPLQECVPLLQLAVDGPDRREREVAVAAEVLELFVNSASAMRALSELRAAQVISDETLTRVGHHCEVAAVTAPRLSSTANNSATVSSRSSAAPPPPAAIEHQQQQQQHQQQHSASATSPMLNPPRGGGGYRRGGPGRNQKPRSAQQQPPYYDEGAVRQVVGYRGNSTRGGGNSRPQQQPQQSRGWGYPAANSNNRYNNHYNTNAAASGATGGHHNQQQQQQQDTPYGPSRFTRQ